MMENESKWSVSYLSWKAFRKAMLRPQGEIWEKMTNADLVIGGMNFSIDFMYLSFLAFFH
jgi:hypothetical protein